MENTNTKRLVDELFEVTDNNKEIIKTFEVKDNLSPTIFSKDGDQYIMIESVRNKLLEVSNAFFDFLNVNIFIYDIVLTGSMSNYNWSEYSDIDLHILVDLNEFDKKDDKNEIIKEFFNAKKNIWNSTHNIKIKKYDVEIYVEDINEKHFSSGIYSILNNEWLIQPKKEKYQIDDEIILRKAEEYSNIIDDLTQKSEKDIEISDDVKDLKEKIKKFRQTGLETGGEFSYENLTFKLLRRNGYIEKLYDLIRNITNKKLSLNENVNLEYSIISKLEKKAIELYGTTEYFSNAGFITPNGYLLDFSEGYGSRVQDHRNLNQLFDIIKVKGLDTEKLNKNRYYGLRTLVNNGFIRYIPEIRALDIGVMPTHDQFRVIRELIEQYDGKIEIELEEKVYLKHLTGTPSYFIKEGIIRYFKYGVKPKTYDDFDDDDNY